MLTKAALESAQALTEVMDANRLSLVPIPGTPLEALVNATRSDQNFMTVKACQDYWVDTASIEYIANAKDPVFDKSPHDLVMDDITEVAIKAVQGHIVFAKSVVAPAVAHLVECTMVTLNELTPSVLLSLEVVICTPPAPLNNSSFETSVRKYEEVSFDVPKMNLRLPSLTVSEIVDLLKTGTSSLDQDIGEWVAALGDSWLINLWENVFQIKQANLSETTPVTFKSFVEHRTLGVDYAVAIHLLSRKLADAPPAGTEMSLNIFQTTIIEYRNQSGARVCRALDELATIEKNGVLVRSIDGSKITVNSSVYRKYIEAGGENEVLFGNLLDLPSVVTVEHLNEKAGKLKAVWSRHSALTATVEHNRRFARTKEILFKHFQTQMRDIPEGEEATLGNRETVIRQFRDQVELVSESEMSDLYALCLRLVCRSRFYRTDAERILSGIERIKKENPLIEVREAAAVSVIEYTAYWLASQFRVIAV